MKLLRAATLIVSDLAEARERYCGLLEHVVVDEAPLDARLAAAWGAPASAGAPMLTLAPASGAEIFIRLIQQAPVPGFKAQTTYGWQAVELCVTDVLAVNERVKSSRFKIIGPPTELPGLPTIFPMQVEGPDGEVVYFTQIRGDLPSYDLPRATSLIDKAFIYVLACSDMAGALNWVTGILGLSTGREVTLAVPTLSDAFGLPSDSQWTLTTVVHERDVFLELDQMIPQARPRPALPGALPPGVAVCSMTLPDFHERLETLRPWMIAPPAVHPGPVYGGRLSATLRGPDGTLFEVVAP
ncbi:MAG: hypothetical protein MUF14_04395 [Hyphomonadaceae bacterium]|nr:hypothetical protein [Hyphomonadaceae bacterium]